MGAGADVWQAVGIIFTKKRYNYGSVSTSHLDVRLWDNKGGNLSDDLEHHTIDRLLKVWETLKSIAIACFGSLCVWNLGRNNLSTGHFHDLLLDDYYIRISQVTTHLFCQAISQHRLDSKNGSSGSWWIRQVDLKNNGSNHQQLKHQVSSVPNPGW